MRAHEVPPKWMWPHYEELEEWFDEVDIARGQEFNTGDDRDEVPMTGNELSARFRD